MNIRAAALLCALTLCLTAACAPPPDTQHELPPFGQNLPEGYSLVYETDFSSDSLWDDFALTDPDIWRRVDKNGESYLELHERIGGYKPEVRSPHAIALLTKMKVGDFILEVDAESTNISAGAHRDTCYFFGFMNPENFYYVHIASGADPNAHNIFLVKDAPRTNIATYTTKGIDWGIGIRHRIRIERTVKDGAIRIYFDDMQEPIMKTTDTHFALGYVGLGSFDDTARYYAMKLYAPETTDEPGAFYSRKTPKESPAP